MQDLSISLSVTEKWWSRSFALLPGSLTIKNQEAKPNRSNTLQVLCTHMVVFWCVCVCDLPWLDGLTTFLAIFAPSDGGRQSNYISRFLSETPSSLLSHFPSAMLPLLAGRGHRSFQLPLNTVLPSFGYLQWWFTAQITHSRKGSLKLPNPRPPRKPILIRKRTCLPGAASKLNTSDRSILLPSK